MKKYKLLLINPPKLNAVMLENDEAAYESVGAKPPLNLLFLSHYIERNLPEVNVRILDLQFPGLNSNSITKSVSTFGPDVVGITSCTEFWYDTNKLAENIKKIQPNVHICIGGPNAGVYPDIILENKNVDSVICGYGEKPLKVLLEVLMGKSVDTTEGLYFKEDLKIASGFKYNYTTVDDISGPLRRDKLPILDYSSIFSHTPVTTMITSKGCPYKCTYCKIQAEKFCSYPVDFVIDEFRSIRNLGIKEIEIYDDTFTVSKKRVEEICNRLIDEKITLSWNIRDKVTNSDIQLLSLMKKAGLKRINYGIEAASDDTLAVIKKKIKIAQVKEAIRNAKKAGITTFGYFMIGLPTDTKDDFQRILDFSIELDLDYANYSAVIPYPGTELYDNALSQGIIQGDVWKQYVKNPSNDFKMPLYTENCKREDLIDFVNKCYKKFYFRPKRMLKEVNSTASLKLLFRKFKTALKIFNQ